MVVLHDGLVDDFAVTQWRLTAGVPNGPIPAQSFLEHALEDGHVAVHVIEDPDLRLAGDRGELGAKCVCRVRTCSSISKRARTSSCPAMATMSASRSPLAFGSTFSKTASLRSSQRGLA